MLSLGIIGPGLIWEHAHRDTIQALSNRFAVRAVAARSQHNRDRGAAFYPDARVYDNAMDLIEDPSVEAVVVLTPIALNAPLARAALAAGKHAIVEKPVARSTEEARDLIETESRGVLYILEQHVHKSMAATVRDVIDKGRIGTPVSFEYAKHVRIDTEEDQTGGFGGTEWRVHPDFPLGNFFDGGIHDVVLLHEIFGPARAVYGRSRSVRDTYGEVDLLSMVLEYDNEVQGTFAYSSVLGAQGDFFVIHGTTGALRCGDRAVSIVDGRTGKEEAVPFSWEPENRRMWEEIAAVLPRGVHGRYTPERAVRDLATMEALQASLETGRRAVIV